MKIKRFNKINEDNSSDVIWIFTDYDNGFNHYDNVNFVFDNEKDAFNFMANKIYNIFEKECKRDTLDEALSTLDECEDLDSIIEFLNDCVYDEEFFEEYDDKLSIDKTTIDKNIELDDWIELRRNAKKYNV